MTVEAELINTLAVPFGGGAIGGYLAGFFLKKILKILMFVAGGLLAVLMYLQAQEFLTLNWNKISGAVDSSIGTLTNSVITGEASNQVISSLGIPLGSGVMVGFILGFSKA